MKNTGTTAMNPDRNRFGAFLSYKGFQWEPLEGQGDTAGGSMDFRAHQKGTPCFRGTAISIGGPEHGDGSSEPGTADALEHNRWYHQLANRLTDFAERIGMASEDPALPVVAMIANHVQGCNFEDFCAMLSSQATKECTVIHLFIWFDDFKDDKMLFCQTDPALYQRIYNWFHVE